MKIVAIIGGGFSGTLTAIQLLKRSESVQIKLINNNYPIAQGVAFNSDNSEHLLNVPAGRMSAYSDQPNHFIEWLKTQPEFKKYITATIENEFIPRFIYGEYLNFVFNPYTSNKQLEVIEAKAINIQRQQHKYIIYLNNSTSFLADDVVLATGNFLPAHPKIKNSTFFESPNYFQNPWNQSHLKNIKTNESILLIGTGLTMVDCVMSLKNIGYTGKIIAVSPRGYAPVPHQTASPYPHFYEEIKEMNLYELFKTVRKHLAIAASQNNSWHAVIDSLRPYVQKIWIRLSQKDKQQFISHLRHIWGVARHRLPQQVHKIINELVIKGQLEIIAGRLTDIKEQHSEITVTIQLRKNTSSRELVVSRIVNCTGPFANYSELNDELINNLSAAKLIIPDSLKMGIKTTDTGNVLKNNNEIADNMFAIGSLLRGTLWETTAVPEIRVQAENIAAHIINDLDKH